MSVRLCTLTRDRQIWITGIECVVDRTIVGIVVTAEIGRTHCLNQNEKEVNQMAYEHEPHGTQLCQP